MAGSHDKNQESPKLPNAGQQTGGVFHQRSRLPICPMKIALGGIAFVTIGYLTLCPYGPLRRKSETKALEAAEGTNTRPRN